MNFNSFIYIAFLVVVTMAHFALPQRWRWALLLAASYYFYMSWNALYAILLVSSTVIDWYMAICMERTGSQRARRGLLGVSLVTNLGMLFAFKYYAFAMHSFERVMYLLGTPVQVPLLHVLLPVGISFYIFQSLSYTIDVFNRQRSAEHHLGIFALYVVFFPQLVAGPIERSTTLLPQFRREHRFRAADLAAGVKLIIWGMVKKVVVADRLAAFVDTAYALPWERDGLTMLLATYLFAFQIYCDFSAYSDIAIGSARILGYDLMINFRRPYFATTLTDFWRRWHVSLSTWFRDYVYFPMGGNRVTFARCCANLMTVFVISGVWHGASWTFIIWGFIHGVILVAERVLSRLRDAWWVRWWNGAPAGLRRALGLLITFHIVILSWVFFRAAYVQDAFHVVKRILLDVPALRWEAVTALAPTATVGALFALVALLLAVEGAAGTDDFSRLLTRRPRWQRWSFYYAMLLLLLVAGKYDGKAFIYFQF